MIKMGVQIIHGDHDADMKICVMKTDELNLMLETDWTLHVNLSKRDLHYFKYLMYKLISKQNIHIQEIRNFIRKLSVQLK